MVTQLLIVEMVSIRYAIGLISAIRRYLLIPNVLVTTVLLCLRIGGDTVSVMLNTMATVFMLELDNLAFDYGLTITTKTLIQANWKVALAWQPCRTRNLHPRYPFKITDAGAERRRHLNVGQPLPTFVRGPFPAHDSISLSLILHERRELRVPCAPLCSVWRAIDVESSP